MFNKLTLAAIVAAAGMMMTGPTEAQADNCRYGGGYGSYRSFAPAVRVAPHPAAYRYTAPVHRGYSSAYRGYSSPYRGYSSPYRSSFGGSAFGYGPGSFGPGIGFGSPYYGRGSSIGFGRGGVTIGFGF